MTRKKSRFSLPRFFHFLEAVWEEKLVKNSALQQWQEAVAEFQKVMNADEVADLRCVEIKKLSNRYIDFLVDRRSSITPWRINQLKNSLAQAIGDFVAFTVNPKEYKRGARLAYAKQVYINRKSEPAPVLAVPMARTPSVRMSTGLR